MILPLVLPAVVAGSIFTFSLTLGDYITPTWSRTRSSSATSSTTIGRGRQPAVGRGLRDGAHAIMAGLPARRPPARRVRGAVMTGRAAPDRAAGRDGRDLAFLYLPLAIILLYAFNAAGSRRGRPRPDARLVRLGARHAGDPAALSLSLEAALGATAVALVLGSLAAFAVHRFAFFGREAISLPAGPADRAARDRDRHRAEHRVPDARPRASASARSSSGTPRSASSSSTTTSSPGSAARPGPGGGIDGPRRRHLADVPLHHGAAAPDGARGRRACSRSPCPSTRSS